jgi:hypothetical protein
MTEIIVSGGTTSVTTVDASNRPRAGQTRSKYRVFHEIRVVRAQSPAHTTRLTMFVAGGDFL